MAFAATGAWRIDAVSAGGCWCDGGAMHGVVPKPLWSRHSPADERNRIHTACNALLLRGPGLPTTLVDAGHGGKAPPKVHEIFSLDPGDALVADLARLGVAAEEIDMVILSHLHFDHAGGATRWDEAGAAVPTFPNADYVVQRREWEDATSGAPELANAYFRKDFLPLAEHGRLRLADGEQRLADGLTVLPCPGHTPGMQLVEIAGPSGTATFLADLVPLHQHLRTFWTMAYDLDQLAVRRAKKQVLDRLAVTGGVALFDHDPAVKAATVRADAKEGHTVLETVTLPLTLG